MKVRMNKRAIGPELNLEPGQVVDVPDKQAHEWIKDRTCDPVEPTKRPTAPAGGGGQQRGGRGGQAGNQSGQSAKESATDESREKAKD